MEKRVILVGKGGVLPFYMAVFDNYEDAEKWTKSANRWYGDDHPLTPLVIMDQNVMQNPRPFPDPDGTIDEIFANLAD